MEEEYWTAVERRDRRFDGRFVFGVKTTGIYCRPSCPARRPKREHVRFFAVPAEAEAARFRACLRCKPSVDLEVAPRRLVDSACKLIDTRLEDGVRLGDLCAELGCGEGASAGRLSKRVGTHAPPVCRGAPVGRGKGAVEKWSRRGGGAIRRGLRLQQQVI